MVKIAGEMEVTAAEAAVRLRLSRERVVRLVQIGELRGRRDPTRGWLVDEGAVVKLTRPSSSP